MSITKEDLKNALKFLNLHSKCLYGLDYAYGKVRLTRIYGETGGVKGITPYLSKRELLTAINSIYEFAINEENAQ